MLQPRPRGGHQLRPAGGEGPLQRRFSP